MFSVVRSHIHDFSALVYVSLAVCAALSGTAAAIVAAAVVTAVVIVAVAAATSYLCTRTATISNVIRVLRAFRPYANIFSLFFLKE